MRKIESYIVKELGVSFLFVLCVLAATLWVVQSLRFITIFLRSSEGFFSFVKLIMLMLPDLLTIIIPISLFLAICTVFNRLYADRESVVLFALGYTRWDLAKPVLKLATALTLFVYFLSLVILPASFRQMRHLESRLKASFPAVLAQEGVFTSFSDLTLYVNKKYGSRLEGILAHIHKQNENAYTISAKHGEILVQDGVPKIFMINGTRQEKDTNTNELSVLFFDKTIISLAEEVDQNTKNRPQKVYERGIFELLALENFQESGGLNFVSEGLQRLLTPLYSLLFAGTALYFLLFTPFRRRGNYVPIAKAVFCTILLQAGCITLLNIGRQTLWASVGAYVLVMLYMLYIFHALQKDRKDVH